MSNSIIVNGRALQVPAGAIAYKYADPTEGARWIYDEQDLQAIRAVDSTLIVEVTPVHYPRVNLNGTPRARLLQERIEAGEALTAAIAAVTAIEPHPRDYQTVRYEMYTEARRFHAQRLASLLVMRDELMAEVEYLTDGT